MTIKWKYREFVSYFMDSNELFLDDTLTCDHWNIKLWLLWVARCLYTIKFLRQQRICTSRSSFGRSYFPQFILKGLFSPSFQKPNFTFNKSELLMLAYYKKYNYVLMFCHWMEFWVPLWIAVVGLLFMSLKWLAQFTALPRTENLMAHCNHSLSVYATVIV